MTEETRTLRVLLADDHPLVRSGIRSTLAQEAQLELVGEATNGVEVVTLCDELSPDLLLLDLSMPESSPLETIASVQQASPDTRILVLTAFADDASIRSVMNVGVDGYLLKDEAPEALVRAIMSIAQGDTWFSRTVMQTFAEARKEATNVAFTPRERALMSGIARGWDNRKLALEFDLAEQTIRNYISRLYDKVGVRSRSEAVVWAREHGFAGE